MKFKVFLNRFFFIFLGSFLTWALGFLLPPSHQTQFIVPSAPEPKFHLQTLRKGLPPFVYKVEPFGYQPEQRTGLFGLQRVPPTWTFAVSIANLTAMNQGMIDISFLYKGHAENVAVAPKAGDLFFAATSVVPHGRWTNIRDPSKQQALHLAPLESGKGKCFMIGITADGTPCVEDIVLSISSPEGKFDRITPVQWASIGWEQQPVAP